MNWSASFGLLLRNVGLLMTNETGAFGVGLGLGEGDGELGVGALDLVPVTLVRCGLRLLLLANVLELQLMQLVLELLESVVRLLIEPVPCRRFGLEIVEHLLVARVLLLEIVALGLCNLIEKILLRRFESRELLDLPLDLRVDAREYFGHPLLAALKR